MEYDGTTPNMSSAPNSSKQHRNVDPLNQAAFVENRLVLPDILSKSRSGDSQTHLAAGSMMVSERQLAEDFDSRRKSHLNNTSDAKNNNTNSNLSSGNKQTLQLVHQQSSEKCRGNNQ